MNTKAMSLVEIVVGLVILSITALVIASTGNMVAGRLMRAPGGGSLDLQAAGYARETLESLRNAVSTDPDRSEHLEDSDGGGTLYDNHYSINALPADSDLAKHGGARSYRVWDIDADGDGVPDYKKVTVTVTWDD
ncbi:MAG: hypothetical protein BWY42_00386 [Candidatus Omnitrophica bacterium ADurb.Bin277]|nr:MAG: hypothetical protein BWY42_00386 [Candidatus Omnitrophica bacterium ADurb.Bin277]